MHKSSTKLMLLMFAVLILLLAIFYPERQNKSNSLLRCEQELTKVSCEKIGQMLIVGFGGLKQDLNGKILWEDTDGLVFKENSNIAKHIQKHHIGGVILFTRPFRNNKTGVFIRDRNIQHPKQLRKLNQDLQSFSTATREKNALEPLPLLISVDQEGGMVDRLPHDLTFPLKTFVPQALGANEEKVFLNKDEKQKALLQTEQYAQKMADTLLENNFNTNFVPCVDLDINPLNFIIGGRGRSFSANPEIVFDQAQVFVQVFNSKNIIPALKHFPGHGSSQEDTHMGLVDVTDTYQKEKELLPYRMLIKNGYEDLIMTTHVINGQFDKNQCKKGDVEDHRTWCPGTMSYPTLTTLLREELGFKGVIVSDDMTMGAVVKEYPLDLALEKAINAGVDMFIIANNYEDNTELVISTIVKLIKEGRVNEAEIERAYRNISALKKRRLLTSSS